MTTVWRYVGDRTRFIGGVPARDLNDDDWARLSLDLKRRVRQSDLYTQVSKEEAQARQVVVETAPAEPEPERGESA